MRLAFVVAALLILTGCQKTAAPMETKLIKATDCSATPEKPIAHCVVGDDGTLCECVAVAQMRIN